MVITGLIETQKGLGNVPELQYHLEYTIEYAFEKDYACIKYAIKILFIF